MCADHTIATAHTNAESHIRYGCCEPCAADAHGISVSQTRLGVGGRSHIGTVT